MEDFDDELYQARMLLAANVQRLRQERNFSQEGLAAHAGIHRTFVSHMERGARNLTLDNLTRISLALEVPMYELFMPL
ncbi:helix-turn-helix domain-containing protein [Paucibacter sp. M5-1]|uniref:helix-turn-helix domain-containing protein n=1 Tax=Paucibacter sp. M5-1 TaxID=3015998 RepID=UPI0022B8EC4C|nr:helix-turn-helix transcriptional regulator [Paucibacter sp. M5-1]MCZ7884634.1 helix-turn-helix transcriptional regulator [Paucibacter sp. M5-1]